MIFASIPYRIMHVFQIPIYDPIRDGTRTSTAAGKGGFDA